MPDTATDRSPFGSRPHRSLDFQVHLAGGYIPALSEMLPYIERARAGSACSSRLGDGLKPDLDLSVFDAFNGHMASEAAATAALARR